MEKSLSDKHSEILKKFAHDYFLELHGHDHKADFFSLPESNKVRWAAAILKITIGSERCYYLSSADKEAILTMIDDYIYILKILNKFTGNQTNIDRLINGDLSRINFRSRKDLRFDIEDCCQKIQDTILENYNYIPADIILQIRTIVFHSATTIELSTKKNSLNRQQLKLETIKKKHPDLVYPQTK